jgi:hypothetical protein
LILIPAVRRENRNRSGLGKRSGLGNEGIGGVRLLTHRSAKCQRESHRFWGTKAQGRVFNIEQLGNAMRGNRASLSREKAARMTEAQASIGRAMRLIYDVSQPLTNRLSDLVRIIEQPQPAQDKSQLD